MRILNFFLFLALGFAAAQAYALDEVTVGLPIPQSVYGGAPYAAAQELGLFKEQNLHIKILVFHGAGTLLPQVASKRVTFGWPAPAPVISSYSNGKKPLPVRYFYNATPIQTLQYAVLKDSPIKTLNDLKGKRIGVGALTWGTIPTSRAALRIAGLEPGKNVKFIAVGALASGFQALKSGKVDALNFNSSWNEMLALSGTPIRRINYPPVLREMPANGFIANVDTFKKHPDLIRRFGRAYTEAVYVCEANPTFCVHAFWRQHPESKPADAEGKGLDDARKLLTRRLHLQLYRLDGSPRQPGKFNMRTIKDAIAAMAKAGEFTTADVPVKRIYSNKFVSSFSDFDKAALIKRAKAAK